MFLLTDITLESITLHKVGNKLRDEGINFSKKSIQLSDSISRLLLHYFLSSFKSEEYFNFFHSIDVNMNEVFVCAGKIFDDPKNLYEQSKNISKHLYEQSTHPQIKSGEFYVVHFTNCTIEGKTVDAIGLFKSENKDTFLKINVTDNSFDIKSEKGININKLDKGCLIFNVEKENGYIVTVVDNTNKKIEAKYWIDDFLHIKQRKDEYYNTQNVLSLCKSYITKELPQQFEISKADQAEILNKSIAFFKESENFNMADFEQKVIREPNIIENFNQFKVEFQKEREISIANEFQISNSVVNKQSKIFKSIIKLDSNFDIHIHSNSNQFLKKGFDKDVGMSYYKLYFKEEQ